MLLKRISQKLGLTPMISNKVIKNSFSTISSESGRTQIKIEDTSPKRTDTDLFTANALADWEPKVPKHTIKIDNISYRQPHPVWDLEDSEKIEITHYTPKRFADKYALYAIRFCRWAFDKVTFYDKSKMNESKYLTRAIFLETIAAIPGMVGGMHRHMKSLRTLQPDGGWIHHLLEEAENERMHLLTFLQIKQPGLFLRLSIMGAQFVFTAFYAIHYIFAPNTAHRLVGYLEEEAVHTYTNMIKDFDRGQLPKWAKLRVSLEPKRYWELPEDATMRDLILAIRADEVNHREFNHHFADIRLDDPFPEHKEIQFLIKKGKETDHL